ncbi:MAG: alpha/beta fold hydrolase, partial [Janthinobacterium lividum]
MHDRVPRLPPQDGRRTPASPPSRKRGTLAGRAAGLIGGSIVALAGAALFNGARARAAVRANPPRGRFVDIDGVAIHYVEHGAGPPLVLIHGNGSMIQDFELSGIVGPLAETHRVVIFDRPGSGYSSRPGDAPWTAERQAAVLVAAADRLGLVRPVVVGHSWGTLPALHWALDHGEKISALVLMSGYYFPSLRLDVLANAPTLVPVLGGIVRQSIAPI